MATRSADPQPREKEIDFTAPPSKKSKKILLIIIALIVLLAGGAGAVMFFAPERLETLPSSLRILGPKNAGPGPSAEKVAKDSFKANQWHIYNMEPFIVNLADTDRSRYLKIHINIESQDAWPNEEYARRLPQLRDTILMVLTSKTTKDIFDSEGKGKLRAEIIVGLNQVLTSFKVKTVYFTEFMIQ